MVRTPLRVLASLSLSVVAAMACNTTEMTRECTLADCMDGASVEANLPGDASQLTGANVEVCWNERCATGPIPELEKQTYFALGGAGVYASANVFMRAKDWSRLTVSISPTGGERVRDGDRYRLAVTAPDGKPLIDVERFTSSYSTFSVNGPECGPTCRVATVALYPDSASGLTCTGNACAAGAVIHQLLEVGPQTKPANVSICRNDTCLEDFPIDLVGTGGYHHWLRGALIGSFEAWYESATRTDIKITIEGETRTLQDGDRYRVTLTDLTTNRVITDIDRHVTYESAFPNGEACDMNPCRTVRIEGP